MKTRYTSSSLTFLQGQIRFWTNGSLTDLFPGTFQRNSWQDYVTVGDNLPDWKGRIARGENATTYLEGNRKYRTYSPGFRYTKTSNPAQNNKDLFETQEVGSLTGFIPWDSDPATLSTVEANRVALTRFNARVLEVNQTFNGGVFLGELGQTIRGIKHPAESLFRSIGSYRREARELRSSIAKSREHLSGLRSRERRAVVSNANRAIAGLWLEKQFHWEPLLSDIDDGAKALAEMAVSPERWRIVSSTGRDKTAVVVASPGDPNDSLGPYSTTDIFEKECSVRYKGAVGIVPKDSVSGALGNLGLDLRNFVPTIWELMPYSFVADYFSNIGDVLNGWSSGGYGLRWCCRTARKSTTATRTFQKMPLQALSTRKVLRDDFRAPTMVSGWTRVQRDNYLGSFIPSLTWEIPGVSTKWLNLAALGSARFLDRFL